MSADTLAERIRERAREVSVSICGELITSDPTLYCGASVRKYTDQIADFITSELSAAEQAARKEEREQCCKDVCEYCADTVNWEPSGFFATAAYEAAWRHQRKTPDNCGRTQYALECKAASIRNRE